MYTTYELSIEEHDIRTLGWAALFVSAHSFFLMVLAVFAPRHSIIAIPVVTIFIGLCYYWIGIHQFYHLSLLLGIGIVLSFFVIFRPSKFDTKEIFSVIPFIASLSWYILLYIS
ncbi:MAG: hypothetical protein COA32_03145 [Fluviicola sp.]|nr:MAG: hypothetical protein COA32_03145 [Fluviicola sp.]